MRSKLRATLASTAAAALVLGSSGLAFADTVVVSPDVTRAPGQASSFVVGLIAEDDDGVNNCNAAGGPNATTVQFASSNGAVVAAPASILLNGCDDPGTANVIENAVTVSYTVSGTAKDGDTATITATASGGKSPGKPNVYGTYDPDSITISVATPLPSDTTAPVIAPIVTGTLGQGGWYTSDVTVSWSVSDDEGPITSSTGCGPTTLGTDTAGRTLTCTATSAGGTSTKSVTIKRDATAPAVRCAESDGAWHADNVSLGCTASDSGSGIADADKAFSLATSVAGGEETSNASTGSRTVTDAAGNSASAGPIAGNKIDRKAPEVSCGSDDGTWHAGNVTIDCTAKDGGSGLANGGDATFTLSTNVAAGDETGSASTGSRQVADAVGNTTTVDAVTGIKVDRKAPVVTCAPVDDKWHKGDVTLACTAVDNGSGVTDGDRAFTLSTSVVDGEETGNAATDSREVSDKVGNSVTVGPFAGNKVDKKAPQISCGSDDGTWHNANVAIACTAKDGGSGLADSGDASFTLSTTVADGEETDDAWTGSHDVSDAVGNTSTAGPVKGIKVDRKAPEVSCDPVDSDWHTDDVTLTCRATDGGSGLADDSDASFTLSTNVADGSETDNASTGKRVVSDAVGNEVTVGPFTGIKVDKKAPEVSCTEDDGTWHKANVTLTCKASDLGSGLVNAADASFTLSTTVAEGEETDDAWTGSHDVSDALGHTTPAGPVKGIKVDRKAPQISCGSDDGTWHNANVDIACTAKDGGSGLADSGDAAFTLSTTVAKGEETDDASTGSHDVSDAVGNTSTAGPVKGIKVDRKAPEVSCDPVDSNWHTDDVTLTCHAVDNGSGLADLADASFTLSTNVADGSETNNASTDFRVVEDVVGNDVTVGPFTGIKVDRKAPEVSCGEDDGSWHGTNVTITCTAQDDGSGLAVAADASFTLSTTVADGEETDDAWTGSHDVSDALGHTTTAGPIKGIKVDRKAPTITWSAGAGSDFYYGDQVTAPTCTAADGGSGLAGGCTVSGFSTAVGTHTVTATATDKVGNVGRSSLTYTVKAWTLDGFYKPVDMGLLNTVKAGSTVPLKFNVFKGSERLTSNIGATFSAKKVACGGTVSEDAIEEFATSGKTELRYDPTSQQWIQNWATPKLGAGSCYKVTMTTADGTTISADFKLK